MQKFENCFWNLMSRSFVALRDKKFAGDCELPEDVFKMLGRRWSQNCEAADLQHILNWRVAVGFD